MRHTAAYLVAYLAMVSVLAVTAAAQDQDQDQDESVLVAFGADVAAQWDGLPLACPDGSLDWFDATPETLFCFRAEMSGLEMRSRLNGFLERRGTWLNAWRIETPELVSRPYWVDGRLYRIVVGSSFSAPRHAVVFIRHSILD
jgi:hypothetical protein